MILSVGAVNSHLVKLGLRGYCSINTELEALDTTFILQFSVRAGATTINPYLVLNIIYKDTKKNYLEKLILVLV